MREIIISSVVVVVDLVLIGSNWSGDPRECVFKIVPPEGDTDGRAVKKK